MAVRFLGVRHDVPALLAAADVVVVPSNWEGQPLVVQEALRAGRPLVATRVGGIAELTGSDGAVLVPPGHPVALAAAVTRLLDDPEAAGWLRRRGPGRRCCPPGRLRWTRSSACISVSAGQLSDIRNCARRYLAVTTEDAIRTVIRPGPTRQYVFP